MNYIIVITYLNEYNTEVLFNKKYDYLFLFFYLYLF